MHYILLSHITFAIITGITVLWSWTSIIRNKEVKKLAKILQALTVLEIISGAALSITSHDGALQFCTNILLYTAIVTTTMVALEYKSKKTFSWKPIVQNLSLALASMVVVLFK